MIENKMVKYHHQLSGHEFEQTPGDSEGLPDSSVGKESAYNAGDPHSIPGLGRSAGEGIVFFSTHSSILGHPLWLNW